jgi:hypothetical protein
MEWISDAFVELAALNGGHEKGAGGAGGAPELEAEPVAGDGKGAWGWVALSGRPVGIGGEGGQGEAPAAEGAAGSGQEAGEVVAVAHEQRAAEGRKGSGRLGEPVGESRELAGGILAAAINEEGPGASAVELGGSGLAGEGAAEEEQGPGGALKGGIEAVVAVKHHHEGGAAGGGQRSQRAAAEMERAPGVAQRGRFRGAPVVAPSGDGAVLLQQGDHVSDLLGVEGGGDELVAELNKIASILALSSASRAFSFLSCFIL